MIYYATLVEQALNSKVAFDVWDDNGNFQTYIRSSRKWNDLKDVIIHTFKESPTQLKADVVDTTVTLSWLNRTSKNDSIYLDRRTENSDFVPIATLSSSSSQFYDSGLKTKTVYYYRLRTNLLDSIDLYSYPIAVTIVGIRKPYLGSPVEIPGTIQAENFDIGGEGQTYHDSNTSNKGGAYRKTEGVDIAARPDGGYQVGYVANGEWTQYSVHVSQHGYYRIDTYTASVLGGGKYSFTIGKTTTSSIKVPITGDSTTVAVSSVYRVLLDTGNQILTFKIASASNPFTIDRFVFVQDSSKTAIHIQSENIGFSVFPNPAFTYITVHKPGTNSLAKLEIFNDQGERIQTELLTNIETTFSVERFEKGIYLFVLTTDDSVVTKRIMVQK